MGERGRLARDQRLERLGCGVSTSKASATRGNHQVEGLGLGEAQNITLDLSDVVRAHAAHDLVSSRGEMVLEQAARSVSSEIRRGGVRDGQHAGSERRHDCKCDRLVPGVTTCKCGKSGGEVEDDGGTNAKCRRTSLHSTRRVVDRIQDAKIDGYKDWARDDLMQAEALTIRDRLQARGLLCSGRGC
ncbi:hypothetical protein L1887_51434 [Cichorium endivia]|nr:hypothetical protein L1887_51434 [Cichorium endivia]